MKAIFLITGILFGSTTFTCAQDSTRVPIRQGDPSPRQTPDQIRKNNLKDMVMIRTEEVPSDVSSVLQDAKYRGGKKTYYKHKERDEYAVEIQSGEITYFHLFDKNGKPIYRQN